MRDVVQSAMTNLPFQKRKLIADTEQEIGEGKKGIESFTFGQLVGLIQRCRVLDDVATLFARDCRALTGINLGTLRDIRNQAVHGGVPVTLSDARFFGAAFETYLAFFDVQLAVFQPEPRNLDDIKEILERSAASVEVIEGTAKFFKRLAEVLESGPGIDRFDATFLAEGPPRVSRSPSLATYWSLVSQRTLEGRLSLRRIVTFNNPEKLAWILFGLVAKHTPVFEDLFRLALFRCEKDRTGGHVMVPNIGLAYSSEEITDGHAWIYQHEEGDRQNYIFFRGKSIFSTYRRIYNSWFSSCRQIDARLVGEMYREAFGPAAGPGDVLEVMRQYKDRLGLSEPDLGPESESFFEAFLRG